MSLTCTACGHALTEMKVGDILVDVCQGGCGGIWFDNFELRKVDEQHESAGELLLDVECNPDVRVDVSEKRRCPRCPDVIMRRHYFSVKRRVEIDECASCGGVWLDAGELRDIRNLFDSQEERDKAFKAYCDDVFGFMELHRRQAMQQDLQQTRKAIGVLRYICPSYWISGEQKWGGF